MAAVSRRPDPRNRTYLFVAVGVGIAVFVALVLLTSLPPYLDWLAGWSVAAFGAYAVDKAQATRGGWRVPENVLHGLALIGGAAGAWAGMALFRHKIRKPVFLAVLVVASVVQVALGYVLLVR
jgi:uncharacterized membrane protein YsdA (DUF1294 family)